MPPRIDYYNVSGAAKPNSLIPSVNVVTNTTGDIPMIRRSDNGEPTPSNESVEVHWVPRDQVEALPMDRSMALWIGHYLADTALPHIG
ncbi:hypothetical protein [Microbispora bryophytorum]|uniref:NUDIX hydrolase n=1 Tax=Microbispora bryophytorum subsp. camponoti TaxID=1677852 RepID=A0ABR8L6S4_9ACTN|nr:hypothetical protein [Microbispora camponoti]MBD3146615.1 hypothetical protein [Microbispora camponoti]